MAKKTHTGGIPIREYNRVHRWVGRHWEKKGKCEHCSLETKTHWSNKNQKYTQIRKEWQELCPSCHTRYDKEHFGHTWKQQGRPPIPIEQTIEYEQHLAVLRTYPWFIEGEFDGMADVCILISMRDNVYIKQKYWDLWREIKAQGRIPELLEELLIKEQKTRLAPLNKPQKEAWFRKDAASALDNLEENHDNH